MSIMHTTRSFMPVGVMGEVLARLDVSDRQLLVRFAERGDQQAFGAIMHRHGSLVWGVCRRVLRHQQDAEDAFQATFLLLARKANSVRWHTSIKGWLYQSALRMSQQAQRTRTRRQRRERHAAQRDDKRAAEDTHLREVVQEELLALPDKYRLPLLLCHVEGKTTQQAAQELGWSQSSLRGRLHRAKAILRRRFAKRGIAGTAALLLLLNTTHNVHALAPSLAAAMTENVLWLIADATCTSLAAIRTLTLMKGAMNSMSITKWTARIAACFLVTAIGTGTFLWQAQADSTPAKRAAQPNAKIAQQQDKDWQNLIKTVDPDKNRVGQGVWRIKKGKLIGYPAAHGARLRIPVVPKGDYELRIRRQPKAADSSVHFIAPHGDKMACIDILSAFKCAGLGDINGVRPDINETKTAVTIEAGKTYTVFIRMKHDAKQIYVSAKLDDKKIVDWEGKRTEIEHRFYAPPKPVSLGVAVSGNVSTFHSMELKMLTGKAQPWTAKKKALLSR